MGENEGVVQPSGIFPNGLLPNAGPLVDIIESERWVKAEERTAELISCIQPNQPSEERRNAVADYVQRLIAKCFPCQVFTFGSVPLKTYLPDGDIDLTAFSNNQILKETWASQVRDMLESEEKNENAEFHVKEVQYIQAEVKLIKCLVENIVVDISFNQVGGLCTLCFLEEVDYLISQNHLFKRSIILIKAWCYYESRILGAHHGLISTYALETLVLYIFHVFNNSFAGPLEVLYRFLEFFSNFDWDNFCVSLWGPVRINSLPDVTAETPRKDGGELLLTQRFLHSCSLAYAVFPTGQENQGRQPFVAKHFNVIDPLRVNNNLGRSVSKGNFYRIRSAFSFGAKKLARLVHCPQEDLTLELNQFFMNTWERHGSGVRPDAPAVDSHLLRSSIQGNLLGSDNPKDSTSSKSLRDNSLSQEVKIEGTGSHSISARHGRNSSDTISRTSAVSEASHTQKKSCKNVNSQWISNQIIRQISSNQVVSTDKGQRNLKSESLLNDINGRFLFARTRSSPELTDTYSQGKDNKSPHSVKTHDMFESNNGSKKYHRNRRNNPGLEPSTSHNGQFTCDDQTSVRHVASRSSLDPVAGLQSGLNRHHLESGSRLPEDFSSAVGSQGMHQEEQDIVNMMASAMVNNGFNGQVHLPLNLTTGHLPFPIPPSILASMGYDQKSLTGMVPTNFPLIDPSFSNLQFPHGMVPPQLSHYFAGIGLPTKSEDSTGSENVDSTEMNLGEVNHDYWQEEDTGSIGGFESGIGHVEMLYADGKSQSTSANFNSVSPTRLSSPGSSIRSQQKYISEKRGSMCEDSLNSFQFQGNRENAVYPDDRSTSSRLSSAPQSSSLRSKTSSESSWEEPSTMTTKLFREKRDKKTVGAELSTEYGKCKNTADQLSVQRGGDDQEWNRQSNMNFEMTGRRSGVQSVGPLYVVRHHMPDSESPQTSGSDSLIPMPPMVLGPGSRQRMMDNSGVFPFAFYPTGPPVPFLTMLSVYNVPADAESSDTAFSHYDREGQSTNDQEPSNSAPVQQLDSLKGRGQFVNLTDANLSKRMTFSENSDETKSDILHSDFASHWKNLQFGRFCQNPRQQSPLAYPSPVMVPPMYLQGRFPWDGPGRPLSGNMNVFMNYGPKIVPVSPPPPPMQSVSSRPVNVYQHYADDIPRHRSGTGTYLPNPRLSVRDRHSSGNRRGNFNYDRSDSNGEREGKWNPNSKSRATGRSHNRNQTQKPSLRTDRLAANESRPDRSWNTYRTDTFPSYQLQNGPLHSNSNQGGPPNVAYGTHSVPTMNPRALSSSGPTPQSIVMLYPYDQNPNYGSQAEQLEFGSLGPLGFSGMNEQSLANEGSRERGVFDEHRFQGRSANELSRDQPSLPHNYRRV